MLWADSCDKTSISRGLRERRTCGPRARETYHSDSPKPIVCPVGRRLNCASLNRLRPSSSLHTKWQRPSKVQATETTSKDLGSRQPFDGFRATEYILEAYREASKAYLRAEQKHDLKELAHTAEILCTAFKRLQGDGTLWATLIDLAPRLDKDTKSLDKLAEDFEHFHALEFAVLVKHLDPATAQRLISEVDLAFQLVRRGGGGGVAVQVLQNSITALGSEVCKYSKAPSGWKPFVYRGWRVVRLALFVFGGVALAVGNGLGALHGAIDHAHALASIKHGLETAVFGAGAPPGAR